MNISRETYFNPNHFQFSQVCHLENDPRFRDLSQAFADFQLGRFYGLATSCGQWGVAVYVLVFNQSLGKSLAIVPSQTEFGTEADIRDRVVPIRTINGKPSGFDICLVNGMHITVSESVVRSLADISLKPDALAEGEIVPEWGNHHCCAVTDGSHSQIQDCKLTIHLPTWRRNGSPP